MKKTATKTVTEAQYQESLKLYADANSKLDKVIAKRQEAIQAVEVRYCDDMVAHQEVLDEHFETIQAYCEQNREKLFGTAKSIKNNGLQLGYRKGTPKVGLLKGFKWDDVLALLKKGRKTKCYVRTVEEIDKQKLIADKEVLATQLPKLGLDISHDETFYIKPA